MSVFNFLRGVSTATYRVAVVLTLLLIASELATANKYVFAIGAMIFKVVGGPTS
jgi:hypothetical protein